jgi:hypothetical protein
MTDPDPFLRHRSTTTCGSFRVVEDEFDDGDGDVSAGRDRFRWRTRRRQSVLQSMYRPRPSSSEVRSSRHRPNQLLLPPPIHCQQSLLRERVVD